MFFDNRCDYLLHNRLPAISDQKRYVQQVEDFFQRIGVIHPDKVGFEAVPSEEDNGGFSK